MSFFLVHDPGTEGAMTGAAALYPDPGVPSLKKEAMSLNQVTHHDPESV